MKVFDRSGLPALSDLETPEWKELFSRLAADQERFEARQAEFRSPGYQWYPRPLFNWSRCWEYPYAFHHLSKRREALAGPGAPAPLLIDVGSAVTFFPFALAAEGWRVVATDPDPVCERDMGRAIPLFSRPPGRVEFRRCDGRKLAADSGCADAVSCISVLEHIPGFEEVVAEIARVLKPGGLFILTVDLDCGGSSPLNVGDHARLLELLQERFDYLHPERTVHPADVLHSNAGPYPIWYDPGPWWRRRLRPWAKKVKKRLGWRAPFNLTCQGFALVKKAAPR